MSKETVAIAKKLTNTDLNQNEILQCTFELQIHLASDLTRKNVDFTDLTSLLFEVINNANDLNEYSASPILNVIPSVLYKIDSNQQENIQKLMDCDIKAEYLLQIYQSVSELQMNNKTLEKLYNKLDWIAANNPDLSYIVIKIIIFLFDVRHDDRTGEVVISMFRNLATKNKKSDLYTCSYIVRQRRNSSKELCKCVCNYFLERIKSPNNDYEINNSSFYLLLCLSIHSLQQVLNVIKVLLRKGYLTKCSLMEFDIKDFSISHLIDFFYGVSSFRLTKTHENFISNILYECLVKTESIDLITFAFFNEDESKQLLNISLKAFNIAAQKSPSMFLTSFDIISLLYMLPENIVGILLNTFLIISVQYPDLFNGCIIFLKKMALKAKNVMKVISCLSVVLSKVDEKSQKELLSIIFSYDVNQVNRHHIYRSLAKIDFSEFSNSIKEDIIQRLDLSDLENLNLLVSEDENGLIVINRSPAPVIDLLVSLNQDISKYIEIFSNKESYDTFESKEHLVIQFALRADLYLALVNYGELFLKLFSELAFSLEIFNSAKYVKIISEWCSLKLSPILAEKYIVNDSFKEPLYLYILLRSLGKHKLTQQTLQYLAILFTEMTTYNNKYSPKCTYLVKVNSKMFDDVFAAFREELTIILSKNNKFREVSSEQLIQTFKNEIQSGFMSKKQSLAFISIIDSSNDVKASDLWNLMTKMRFEDSRILKVYTLSLFKKCTISEFLNYSNILVKCVQNNDKSVLLKTKPLKNCAIISIANAFSKFLKHANLTEEFVNLILTLLSSDKKINKTCIKSIFKLLLTFAQNEQISDIKDDYSSIKESIEEWLKGKEKIIDVKKSYRVSTLKSLLQLRLSESVSSNIPKNNTKIETLMPFIPQKWRSKDKIFNQLLTQVSDSDNENYAELEGFLVKEDELDYYSDDEVYLNLDDDDSDIDDNILSKVKYERAKNYIRKYDKKFKT